MVVRPFAESDADAIDAILAATYGHDARLRALHRDRHGLALDPPSRGTLVAEVDGDVVGAGTIYHGAFHPFRTQLSIDVAPAHRRRGIGTALLDELRSLADRPLRTRGLFDVEGGVLFLRRRGFEELAPHWEGGFDPADVLAELPARPVETPELDEAAEFFARWYERDHYWDPPAPIPLEQARSIFCGDSMVPDSLVGVRRDDVLVAAANLMTAYHGDGAYFVWAGADDEETAMDVVAACARHAHAKAMTIWFELNGSNTEVCNALDGLGVLGTPTFATFGEPLR